MFLTPPFLSCFEILQNKRLYQCAYIPVPLFSSSQCICVWHFQNLEAALRHNELGKQMLSISVFSAWFSWVRSVQCFSSNEAMSTLPLATIEQDLKLKRKVIKHVEFNSFVLPLIKIQRDCQISHASLFNCWSASKLAFPCLPGLIE